jgi:hypothetical protein
MTSLFVALLTIALLESSIASAQESRPMQAGRAITLPVMRNPSQLRAARQLDRSTADSLPRVRFEWEQVTGASAYLLSGQWTTTRSWAKQTRQIRVTTTHATTWTRERVAIELLLPPGSHSWKLVSLYGVDDVGDFDRPTQLSFEVR